MTDLTALKYTADHEWIALDGPLGQDGTVATVGITDYAADKLGDVVFIELPDIGATVSAGDVVGEIESTKSVGELYMPLTGEVVAVNDAASDDPSLVNGDPFGDGWLIKVRVDAPAEGADGLLDRAAYTALVGGEE